MALPNLGEYSWLAGAGLVGGVAAIAAGWHHVKNALAYMSSLFVLHVEYQGSMVPEIVSHIRRHYRRVPSGICTYRSMLAQVDNRSVLTPVPFKMPNKSNVFWGKRGIFFIKFEYERITTNSLRFFSDPELLQRDAITETVKRADDASTTFVDHFYVRKIIGTASDSEAAAMERYASRKESSGETAASPTTGASSNFNDYPWWTAPQTDIDRSFMYDPAQYMSNDNQRDPFRGLFYDDATLELVEDIKIWFRRERWYRERNIPWKMGCLLHGPGGTGKSSLARAVGQTLGIPLFSFYLSTLTDREFIAGWDSLATPCVVALEDFDTVFHGRESVTTHKKLNFNCVLNQISGISSTNGVLLIINTNHIEHIDEALACERDGRPTRPGRVDRIHHMGATTEKQRRNLANFVLKGFNTDVIEHLVTTSDGTTAAQFQWVCIQHALDALKTGTIIT